MRLFKRYGFEAVGNYRVYIAYESSGEVSIGSMYELVNVAKNDFPEIRGRKAEDFKLNSHCPYVGYIGISFLVEQEPKSEEYMIYYPPY